MTCHNCRTETVKAGKGRNGLQRYKCQQCSRRFSEAHEKPFGEDVRLPKETVKRQAGQGLLPGRVVEGRWRFLKAALTDWLRRPDGRTALLQAAGAFADDETLPQLLASIYAARGRPESRRV